MQKTGRGVASTPHLQHSTVKETGLNWA